MPTPLLLAEICPTISHRYPNLLVVEITPIELEKLHDQNPQILLGVDLSPADLRMHLKEAYRKTNDAITPQPARENLVHASLTEERFGDHHKAPQSKAAFSRRIAVHIPKKAIDDPSRHQTVPLVDADIHVKASISRDEFDNGDFGFGNDGDSVRYPGTSEGIRERMEDRDFVAVCHGLGENDEINVTASSIQVRN